MRVKNRRIKKWLNMMYRRRTPRSVVLGWRVHSTNAWTKSWAMKGLMRHKGHCRLYFQIDEFGMTVPVWERA